MPIKLYSEKTISLVTLLCGPLAAGILVSHNFRQLNQVAPARLTLWAAILFSAALVTFIFVFPRVSEKIPNAVFPIAYMVITQALVKQYQGAALKNHFANGGEKVSHWRAARIGFLSLGALAGIIILIAMFQPPFPGDKWSFNRGQHDIYVEGTHIPEADINLLAEELMNVGYFLPEYPHAAHLEARQSDYTLTLAINQEFWEDTELLNELTSLENALETRLDKEVSLVLIHEDLRGRKEKRM
jgi:hypothetical protein